MKLRVLREFADKFDGTKIYKVGETLETDDKERVKDLTERRLAEVIAEEENPKPKGQKPKGAGKANGKKSKATDEAAGDEAGKAAEETSAEAAGEGDDNSGKTAVNSNEENLETA